MPGMDGTGPRGAGMRTGRGLGPCGGGRPVGRGMGLGFGRGLGFCRFLGNSDRDSLNETKSVLTELLAIVKDRLSKLE